MKVILVDAWNTFVKNNEIDISLHSFLDRFKNKKIILTNANDKQLIEFGIVNMPYEVFSLSNNPNKSDVNYYKILINHFNFKIENLLYIEHNIDAVNSAKSIGIKTHHYKESEDYKLKEFILKNI
ncbi:MAG: hypothetical protein L7S44_06980 [Flavobacteriaceae bacterium]|jgi:FMN phosphatase YigB (HAD superfamily)|nr:hypothetical protein [Flavobacteriaceae bacterium]